MLKARALPARSVLTSEGASLSVPTSGSRAGLLQAAVSAAVLPLALLRVLRSAATTRSAVPATTAGPAVTATTTAAVTATAGPAVAASGSGGSRPVGQSRVTGSFALATLAGLWRRLILGGFGFGCGRSVGRRLVLGGFGFGWGRSVGRGRGLRRRRGDRGRTRAEVEGHCGAWVQHRACLWVGGERGACHLVALDLDRWWSSARRSRGSPAPPRR